MIITTTKRIKVIITDDPYKIQDLAIEAMENLENDDYIIDCVDVITHPIYQYPDGYFTHQYVITITYHMEIY